MRLLPLLHAKDGKTEKQETTENTKLIKINHEDNRDI